MRTRTLHSQRTFLPVLFITLLLCMIGMTNAMAQTFTVGDLNYSINDDGASVTVTGHKLGQNAAGELLIPESVELFGTSYSVNAIDNYAFQSCYNLTGDLVIPNSVISIGRGAFEHCFGFTGSLTLGNSVTTIGYYAFENCSGFTGSLTFGNSVTTIGEAAFENCSGFTGSLTLGNSVTIIGSSAFSGCSGFTGSLSIPNSVTTIGSWAFSGCSGFTGSLVIPDNVTIIQQSTFRECSGLNGTLTIGNSVTEIAGNAFYHCYGLTGELTIPNSVRTIGVGVFIDCAFTGVLTIGTGVTSMGIAAFRRCTGITEVHWNAINCTYTGNDASNPIFNECSNLTTLVFADNVKTIPDFAFVNNSTFTGTLNLPNSLTSIGNYAFSGCSGFTGSLIIPNVVTTIGSHAFTDCTGFSDTLTLGVSLSAIGINAFFGSCEDFIAFNVLPQTPPALGNNVFLSADYNIPISVSCGASEAYQNASGWSDFTNYQEIDPCRWVILASARPAISGIISGAGTYEQGQTCTLTANSLGEYEFSRWTENGMEVSTDAVYSFVVEGHRNLVAQFTNPNSIAFADPNVEAVCMSHWDTDGDEFLSYDEAAAVTNLGNVFRYNSEITSFDELQFFTGLTYINENEFNNCINLTSVVLPESITSIGQFAFASCNSLTTISIGNSVTSIGYAAFTNCTNLTSITIPNSVTEIGSYAFERCFSLVYVSFPEGLTSINTGVFSSCYSLSSVIFPSSLETIDIYAFQNCNSLTSLELPVSVTSIGDHAFEGCFGLTSLELPASVTSIGDHAFEGCFGLTELMLSDNILSIGYYAFKNCSGLRGELTLPESLETVGGHAFYGCDGISTVNYNAVNCQTMGSILEPVFYDCVSIEHINIGANVQNIPNFTFKHCFTVENMTVAAVNPPVVGSNTFTAISRAIPVSVPYGSGEAYRTAQYWEEFFHITEDYSSSPYAYYWNLNVQQFGDNMTLTGIIQIDGVEQAVPYLEIGAFCNGECRGHQLLTYYPQVDRYLVFLMLYGEEGDMFTFKLYNHETDEESTAGCAAVVTFEVDAILGSFMEPFALNFSDMQLSPFSQGYNWWSTYIEQDGINGLELLENSLGDNGVTIRSQADGYTDYYEGYGWYGSLTSINNESSYRVITNAPCVASMAGVPAVPSEHPITLNQGWTWMGYVPSSAMDINTALDDMEATMGDVVKSQHGYSEYYAGYGWFGSLNTIEPGTGLMYYSTNTNPVTFTYPDGNRGGEMRANLTAQYNHWKPNTYAYPDNMTVMAVVELDGAEISSDNYELAAFAANGECRGSVKLTYAEPLHRYVAFLTIAGKDAAELSFRLYDTETGMEYYDAEESLDFVANAIVGEANNLYVVHFRDTTGMDELANKVQIYPNPVNAGERFSIGMANAEPYPVHVEIVNALGVETLRITSVQTPVSIVAPTTSGVYTLRITIDGKGTVVKKLVVK